MSGVAIVNTLLAASTAVTSIVSTRRYAGMAPQGVQLPALVYATVSEVRDSGVEGRTYVDERVQVTVLAKDYAGMKTLGAAVRGALYKQAGTIGAYSVNLIDAELVGPEQFDSQMLLWEQPHDFNINYFEG